MLAREREKEKEENDAALLIHVLFCRCGFVVVVVVVEKKSCFSTLMFCQNDRLQIKYMEEKKAIYFRAVAINRFYRLFKY